MKILFATPECAPYVKTGGLGDVSGALPAALAALGHDVRVLLPAYRGTKVSGELGDVVDIPAQGPWPAAQIVPVRLPTGVTMLLLTCPSLYQRAGGPYVDSSGNDYDDNVVRFGLLSRVAADIGTLASPLTGWHADIVHGNDWPCGLIPMLLEQRREADPGGAFAASVLTIHNMAYQGVMPMHHADMLGVPWHWRGTGGVEFWGQLSMLKAGLQFADAITTVSPTYAREIRTPEYGYGLDGVLRAKADRLTGILNGIDPGTWNPAIDKLIPHKYASEKSPGKARNKAALQAQCGLEANPKAMLFGIVSRLTPQKGIDLVLQSLDTLLAGGSQLAVLGSGDNDLQQALTAAAARAPGSVHVTLGFDEELAHRIEAGSDCFLMPSRFEPCGLNQMYSQAYGTPPIVGGTGGLLDSVRDATEDPVTGTGFVMRSADADGFVDAVTRARAAYAVAATWRRIRSNGMREPFGWDDSAARYVEVYVRAREQAARH